MSLVIVYAFAAQNGLPPVVGAAVYEVLARQIPRVIVSRMNGSGDAGMRFFPLLGTNDGERQFFSISEMLEPDKLMSLHGQEGAVSMIVDGRIEQASITFRVHDAQSAREVFRQSIEFDPLEPFPAVRRMLFELGGILRRTGAPPELPDIGQPTLSYYLVAKDDLLGLEAGFSREEDVQWLNAIATAFEQLPENADVQALLLDICRHLAQARRGAPEVTRLLTFAVQRLASDGFTGRAAAILDEIGQRSEADELFERLVDTTPRVESVAVRLAGYLFRGGRLADGRDLLERVRADGVAGTRLLSQLAVLYEQLGQRDERLAVVDELALRRDLPPSIGRMVCSEFVEQERIEEAVTVIDVCLAAHPEDVTLWLEKSRILLHGPDPTAARPALESALSHDPPPAVRDEVRRLMRFVEVPHVLPELRAVNAALAKDDLPNALRIVERIVQEEPEVAEGWLLLGVVQQRRDEIPAAIRALQKAVEVDAEMGEAHNRLGILLLGAGQHQLGYEHLKRAVDCLPKESGPRIHMAQACFLLGDHTAGREALREAERLGASPELVQSVRDAFLG